MGDGILLLKEDVTEGYLDGDPKIGSPSVESPSGFSQILEVAGLIGRAEDANSLVTGRESAIWNFFLLLLLLQARQHLV